MTAHLTPCVAHLRDDAGLVRELDVLERLQQSLPDTFEIFHSVAWHTLDQGVDRHGEIDLVVLSPSGNILLLEVKAGDVILRDGEVLKLYGGHEHDVGRQVRVQFAAMVHRLKQARLDTIVGHCLVLPDYRVGDANIVAIPRERIIDASEFDVLGTCVLQLIAAGHSRSGHAEIRAFLANEFRVSVDLQVLGDQMKRSSRRLADGLATWVPRITAPSGVLRIQGTAGSGKTQLALRLLGDAALNKERALYVCFNRTLADHVGRIAPTHARVTSFHELCVDHYRRVQGEPDFSVPAIFQTVVTAYREASTHFAPAYALIIIDEGQDFEPDWIASLLPQLQEQGRLYFLEDDAQRLYEREEFELSGAVTLVCNDNFRSPRAICSMINALALSAYPVDARGPYEGELPGFRVYDGEADLKRQTAAAVRDLQARGIALAEIAVLSARGRAKSVLLNAELVGEFTSRRFTGQYSPDGVPQWTNGELLVESVYRFKGQSAAGVVLSEVDFSELGDMERRKLFVGLTRAHLAVEVVLSREAEACLAEILAG